tara:strand:- start:350 stop:982 length:633 start_codon:yes stop_codon:yes gene_type:complete
MSLSLVPVCSTSNLPTQKQLQYIHNIQTKKPCSICIGPAGTGKTYIGTETCIEELLNHKYSNMIITKPIVPIGNQLGFLPGKIDKKMEPWVENIQDYIPHSKYLNRLIKIEPLCFIRGKTYKDTIILADEMQNSTIKEMQTLLTRIGINSKIVITGDISQCDNPNENGLEDLLLRLDLNHIHTHDYIDYIEFDSNDIKRSDFVKYITSLY